MNKKTYIRIFGDVSQVRGVVGLPVETKPSKDNKTHIGIVSGIIPDYMRSQNDFGVITQEQYDFLDPAYKF